MGCDIAGKNRKNGLNQIGQSLEMGHNGAKLFMKLFFVQVTPQKSLYSPLTPDRHHVKRPPPLLQITSNFLVFYGLSHDTTLKKKGVEVF